MACIYGILRHGGVCWNYRRDVDGMQRVTTLRSWVDDEGVTWTRRGETLEPRRAQRLILDPGSRVLHFGGPFVEEVPAAARAAYWRRVGPYVLGKVRRTGGEKTSDHVDCEVSEFRDAERRVMVVVYEFC